MYKKFLPLIALSTLLFIPDAKAESQMANNSSLQIYKAELLPAAARKVCKRKCWKRKDGTLRCRRHCKYY